MPTHRNMRVPKNTWFQLTSDGAATGKVTLLPQDPVEVRIDVRANATAPADMTTSFVLNKDKGCIGTLLADLCPGVVGAHIYAYSVVNLDIFVSYA